MNARRTARVFAAVLAVILLVLLPAPRAEASSPFKLAVRITGDSVAFTTQERSSIQAALGKLYTDHRVRLWICFVDTFDQTPDGWADATWQATGLGDDDVLLAVATAGHQYAVKWSPNLAGIRQVSTDGLETSLEPALRRGAFAEAAVITATGLDRLGIGPGPADTRAATWRAPSPPSLLDDVRAWSFSPTGVLVVVVLSAGALAVLVWPKRVSGLVDRVGRLRPWRRVKVR